MDGWERRLEQEDQMGYDGGTIEGRLRLGTFEELNGNPIH